MIFDELDISILKEFYNLKGNETKATTWTIAMRLFRDCKNDSEKRVKHNLIISRTRKMRGDLFEIKKESGKWIYTLIEDNIRFCKHRFPDGVRNALLGRIDSKWNVLEI